MPSTEPPSTTFDHKPAYDFAASMRARADYIIEDMTVEPPTEAPFWKEWALVEAYMAGRSEALKQSREFEKRFWTDLGTRG